MNDYIVRATAANNQIRAFAATTRNVVETARAAHGTSPVATAALIAAGVSAKVVQHRLGHADVSITLNTYTHVLPEMDDDAANKLNQSLFSTTMPISHPPVTI